jgi:hypothetical protein
MARAFVFLVLSLLPFPLAAGGQQPSPTGVIEGTVRDESGGVMTAVPIRAFAGEARPRSASVMPVRVVTTDGSGRFSLQLAPGIYSVEIDVMGFAPYRRTLTVGDDPTLLDIVLAIDLVGLAVEVTPAEGLRADTTMSLTATTISGDDLLDLPRNEQDLAEYLLQLAGGDVTGELEQDLLANFVIDGFPEGRLPNPDQIAQIIVDRTSLRADGQGPRIEIITKAGTGKWEGSVDFDFADESLNARTPGESRKEPRQTREVEFEARGPLVANRLDLRFTLSDETDERAAESLRAITPDGDVMSGVVRPEDGREVEIGAILQMNASHRLDFRFTHESQRASQRGVGGFRLPERGSEGREDEWTFQVRERMFRENLTNNVRFQVRQRSSRETPLRSGFAIDVADAFMGGGGTVDSSSDEIRVGLDDTLRWARGDWSFEWEGQLEYRDRTSIDRDNYNGTFSFASLHDYCVAAGFPGINCQATARIVSQAQAEGTQPLYLDARGRAVAITGVPLTFTQAFGNAELSIDRLSLDTHLQADRRFGQKASVGFGLQYTATNQSRDFLRVNPTLRAQYRLSPSTVLTGGVRMAFRDFTDHERLLRNDGLTHETELSISSPSFPDPFQGGSVVVGEDTASLWVLDEHYRSPYTLSPQISVTQQTPGNLRLTLSYNASYGTHQRRTRNINAPMPGTPLPDDILALPPDERQDVVDRMRPMFPYVGNVTQIETTGRSVSRTMRVQVQPRGSYELLGLTFSGGFDYSFRSDEDDNDYTNPYERAWGPSRRDHQVQSRVRIGLPERVDIAQPFLRALARATYENANLNFRLRSNSGRLYSVLSGLDLNGDQATRDRPIGVARNTEVGPANWNLDLTFTKEFALAGAAAGEQRGTGEAGERRGGRGESGGRRVRFQARMNNLLNITQPRAFGSVLTSPLFGLPTGYTNGRTVRLSLSVGF